MTQDNVADIKAAFAEIERWDQLILRREKGEPPASARLLNEDEPEGSVVLETKHSKVLMPREVYEDLKNYRPVV